MITKFCLGLRPLALSRFQIWLIFTITVWNVMKLNSWLPSDDAYPKPYSKKKQKSSATELLIWLFIVNRSFFMLNFYWAICEKMLSILHGIIEKWLAFMPILPLFIVYFTNGQKKYKNIFQYKVLMKMCVGWGSNSWRFVQHSWSLWCFSDIVKTMQIF